VPESSILVDPHARHTTTNMRNAAREMFRYGIPMNKPALVISDAAQIGYIAGRSFADRCLNELGYMPFRIISQPSDISLVFLPMAESLEQDPMDPLDPKQADGKKPVPCFLSRDKDIPSFCIDMMITCRP
jgi:hypothetical protein